MDAEGAAGAGAVTMISRRRFLALLPVALLARPARAMAMRTPKHPTPRPGITAARVLPDAKLHDKEVAATFAMVREIPQVMDGIRCSCGCAELEGFYSLLSCYEKDGMARHCLVCQGQAKLVHRLHREGWSLDGIRKAIDVEFGD
jgi:hypothetical protein